MDIFIQPFFQERLQAAHVLFPFNLITPLFGRSVWERMTGHSASFVAGKEFEPKRNYSFIHSFPF